MGEEGEVRWGVKDGSSEDEVHAATNVLNPDRYRLWQTESPTDDAWLILQPLPPTAFHKVEMVNAGSALVEIHGLREDAEGEEIEDYELLLSSQQVMSVKDLMSKSNRNRAFVYDIDTRKLSPVAAQYKWKKIRVNCRQPFGTLEHRACIGLAYINFTSCEPTIANNKHLKKDQNGKFDQGKSTAAATKRKLPSWAMPSEPLKGKSPQGLKGSVEKCDSHEVVGLDSEPSKHNQDLRKDSMNLKKTDKREPGKTLDTRDLEDEKKLNNKRSLAQISQSETDKDNFGDQKTSKSTTNHLTVDEKDVLENKEPKKLKVDKAGAGKISTVSNKKHSDVGAQPETGGTKRKTDTRQDAAQSGHDDYNQKTGVSSSQDRGQSPGGSRRAPVGSNKVRDLMDTSLAAKKSLEQDFKKILEGVVFAISGIQNPERGNLRTEALEMGAQYRPDWTDDCTLLVCAFMDTPKFKQVKGDDGTIVSKDWIPECYKKRKLVDIDRFLMNKGLKPWRPLGRSSQAVNVVGQVENSIEKKVSCGSVAEIRHWVNDDLTSTMDWLQQQDAKPEAEELKCTAAQGILLCIEDTVKNLRENQGMRSVVENWGFLPRAVKELSAMEEGNNGYAKSMSSSLLGEAERLKGIYMENLKCFIATSKAPVGATKQKMGGSEEEDFDDDATEVMSDVDSQETVDYNSDDTIVMDMKAVEDCTQKLFGRLKHT